MDLPDRAQDLAKLAWRNTGFFTYEEGLADAMNGADGGVEDVC
jgi:hypothetical protein